MIKFHKQYVATHSTMDTLASDQGAAFTSKDFKHFCKINNIRVTYSPVNDRRGTGLVEPTIRTFKYQLLAMKMSQRDTFNLNSARKLATRNLR